MAEQPYLLIVSESAHNHEFITRHLIEAEDRQMVKYYYHKALKESGYTDTEYGTHTLENWDAGLLSDIHSIKELEWTEYEVMKDHLLTWHK